MGIVRASGGEMEGFSGEGGFRGEAARGEATKGSGRRKEGVDGLRLRGMARETEGVFSHGEK